ncbi:NUDIX domain-containing protein [Scleroderma yunnanense]
MSTTVSDTPRPSASLILVNEHNEVLLVQRNTQARSFAGTHVFPGGNFDADQDTSLAMTAIRETFEETGLLVASPVSLHPLNKSTLEQARHAIYERNLDFRTFLRCHGCETDLTSLYPFTTWVTPLIIPRRFRTQFYITFLRESLNTLPCEQRIDTVPTPDGGQEVISTCFVRPSLAIAEFRKGNINLPPPQYYFLDTLCQLLTGNINTRDQRDKVLLLSQGPFGRLVIQPKLHRDPESKEEMFLYEGDELRGGPPGRHHRAMVKRKGTVFSKIDLRRNFDIFKDDLSEVFDITTAKL